MAATISRVTRFLGFRAERLFLAETDGVEALVENTEADEVLLDGIGAAVAEGEIVFGGTTFVAMPLDGDMHLGITFEEVGSPAKSLASYTVNFGGVVVEIGVAHFLEKKLIERRRLRSFADRGSIDGDAQTGVGVPAGPAGGERIGGRRTGSDDRGTFCGDGADFGSD